MAYRGVTKQQTADGGTLHYRLALGVESERAAAPDRSSVERLIDGPQSFSRGRGRRSNPLNIGGPSRAAPRRVQDGVLLSCSALSSAAVNNGQDETQRLGPVLSAARRGAVRRPRSLPSSV